MEISPKLTEAIRGHYSFIHEIAKEAVEEYRKRAERDADVWRYAIDDVTKAMRDLSSAIVPTVKQIEEQISLFTDIPAHPGELVSVIFMSDEEHQAKYGSYAPRHYYVSPFPVARGDRVMCSREGRQAIAGTVASLRPRSTTPEGCILTVLKKEKKEKKDSDRDVLRAIRSVVIHESKFADPMLLIRKMLDDAGVK